MRTDTAVAIDGPLTRGLRCVSHYRAAEALLSRGVFQKRGKPGQTSSPIGQKLHQHATQFANLILDEVKRSRLSIAKASLIEPVHEYFMVEAFPNQFLAALIDEADLPTLHRDATDRYWEHLAACGGLDEVLAVLLPGRHFEVSLKSITDHDQRAAVVCALTGLAVACRQAIGVGDPEDGDIFLPPAELWGRSCSGSRPWMEDALRESVVALHYARNARVPNHLNARVRLHGNYWIQ